MTGVKGQEENFFLFLVGLVLSLTSFLTLCLWEEEPFPLIKWGKQGPTQGPPVG